MALQEGGGVGLGELSQNWKKLQTKLKTDDDRGSGSVKKTARPAQRKAIPRQSEREGKKEDVSRGGRSRGIEKSKLPAKASNVPKMSASLALWAEDNDISAKDLAAAYGNSTSQRGNAESKVKCMMDDINGGLTTNAEAGRYVAIDCEMVGVGPNPNNDSALARVSLVNYHGEQLYDSYVKTKEEVTDYRTAVSGITPQLLQIARPFDLVQAHVAQLTDGKILIGHAISNDLNALLLGHPKRDIRDTSKHAPFRLLTGGRPPGLKRLAREVLGIDIQSGEHSSIEDARATMLLFRKDKAAFEREHLTKWGPDRKPHGEVVGNSERGSKNHSNKARKRKRAR